MPLLSIVATNSTFCASQIPCMGVCTHVGAVDWSNLPFRRTVGVMGTGDCATCTSDRMRKLQGSRSVLGTLLCNRATGLSNCNHTSHCAVLLSTMIGWSVG